VGGIPPSAIWPIFKAASDEHTEIRTWRSEQRRKSAKAPSALRVGLKRVRLRRCSLVTYHRGYAPHSRLASRPTVSSTPTIATLFDRLLAEGVVITECPVSGFAIRVELLSSTARVYCSLVDRPRSVRIFRSASMFKRQGDSRSLFDPATKSSRGPEVPLLTRQRFALHARSGCGRLCRCTFSTRKSDSFALRTNHPSDAASPQKITRIPQRRAHCGLESS
jgi:hypothetical protein